MAIRILKQSNGTKTIEITGPFLIKSWMLFVIIGLVFSQLLYLAFGYFGLFAEYIYPEYLAINHAGIAVTLVGTVFTFLWKPFDRLLGRYAFESRTLAK